MRRLASVVLVAALGLGSARADEPPAVPRLREREMGITLSGGVSLGSYEAGFLHYALRRMRLEKLRPRILTGTSAGSINAFIGLMESCAATGPQLPTDSLLYKTWIPTGLSRLFRPEDVTDTSVLSRGGFADTVSALRANWGAGLDQDCDVRLGTAVTRKAPRSVKLLSSGDVVIPRMTERFLVRIRGRGPGQPPQVENDRTRELGRVLALLPLEGNGAHPFDSLLEVLFASSGFPLAFSPMKVRHCEKPAEGAEVPACTPAEAKPSLFIDGGMFDNRPIGVAYSVLRQLSEHPALLFIDPNLRAWPAPEIELPVKGKGVIPLAAKILFDFIDTAMSAELEHLIEREPQLSEDLYIGLGYYPPASAPMGAFFGFVEEELRRFDFYLGMYNARRFAADLHGVPVAQLGEDGADTNEADHPAWRPLRCMRALWDGDGDVTVQCSGEELTDFRILMQVAGERVVNDCLRSPGGGESKHPLCVAARAGQPAPHVPWVHLAGSSVQLRHESDTDWTMRRLGELGFQFTDLGLPRKHAARGMSALRDRLSVIVARLAGEQGSASLAYQALGAYALNLLHYQPARHLVHLVLGDRVEVGWSYTEPTSSMRWARLALLLDLRGLDAIFSSRRSYFGIAPMAGIDLEPLPLSRPAIQVRLGLHAGFLFSTEDHLLAAGCDVNAPSPCSRPIAEAVLAVSLLSALRLQLGATWLPPIRQGERHEWTLGPSFGVQLPFVGR